MYHFHKTCIIDISSLQEAYKFQGGCFRGKDNQSNNQNHCKGVPQELNPRVVSVVTVFCLLPFVNRQINIVYTYFIYVNQVAHLFGMNSKTILTIHRSTVLSMFQLRIQFSSTFEVREIYV